MMIARVTRCRQWFIGDCVIAGIAWMIITARVAFSANRATAVEIQTKLEAAWMESAAPVKRVLGAKVVPLDCDADLVHVAVQRAPSIFHFTPGMLLGCATGIHPA